MGHGLLLEDLQTIIDMGIMPPQVLYQAKLHPEQKGNSLDRDECKRLHDALFYVCKTATEVDAESSQFPPDWLFHQRWNEKKAQPINGNPLEFIKSAGRVRLIHMQAFSQGLAGCVGLLRDKCLTGDLCIY